MPEPVADRSHLRLSFALLLSSVGVLLVAVADRAGGRAESGATGLFWTGLVVVALPLAVVAVAPRTAPGSRLAALIALTVGFFVVKVMVEPLRFQGVDELQQMRSLLDIARTGHLYEPNPLVSSYPKFPGLLIVTDALSRVAGLSLFVSGLVVVGVARLLIVAGIFLIADRVLGSSRQAAVTALVYVCNPNFLFFGSEFGYESLALPLAVVALLLAYRSTAHPASSRWRAGAASALVVLVIGAVVVSHHMTSVWLTGELVLWLVLALFLVRGHQRRPWVPAVAAVVLTGAWIGLVARSEIADELGPTFHDSWSSLRHLFTGSSGAKKPFASAPNQTADPVVLRAFAFGSVGLLCLLLLAGLVVLLRRQRRSPMLLALALPAIVYPATLVLRLTSAATETASRAAEFLFVGLGLLAGLLVRPLPRKRNDGHPGLAGSAAMVGFVVILVGGVVVGTAPYDRTPQPYRPSANANSITVPGLLAARWAGRNLPRNSYVVADQANRLLMGSYGELHPQLGLADGVPVGHLLLDPRLSTSAVEVVKVDKVRYVVVDRRIAKQLPGTGDYVDGSEPDAGHHAVPVPAAALAKFDHVRGVSRIYDNGVIRIYDVTALQSAIVP